MFWIIWNQNQVSRICSFQDTCCMSIQCYTRWPFWIKNGRHSRRQKLGTPFFLESTHIKDILCQVSCFGTKMHNSAIFGPLAALLYVLLVDMVKRSTWYYSIYNWGLFLFILWNIYSTNRWYTGSFTVFFSFSRTYKPYAGGGGGGGSDGFVRFLNTWKWLGIQAKCSCRIIAHAAEQFTTTSRSVRIRNLHFQLLYCHSFSIKYISNEISFLPQYCFHSLYLYLTSYNRWNVAKFWILLSGLDQDMQHYENHACRA